MSARLLPLLLALAACRTDLVKDTGTIDDDTSHETDEPPETGDTPVDTGDTPVDTVDTAIDTGEPVDTAIDTGEPVDADGDGWYARDDCDDTDASVHPGADEVCNEKDDDCDGTVDEDAVDGTAYWYDGDGDAWGGTSRRFCDPPPTGWIDVGGDCDDTDPLVNPAATELCNGLDDDCDGLTDEDFPDLDGSGVPDCREFCPVYADDTGVRGEGSLDFPFGSITEAIRLRPPSCDEIIAMEGLYDENVVFDGTDLYLHSLSGPGVTTIAPSAGGSAVTIHLGESAAATLEGFTLRGGTGTPGDGVEMDAAYAHGGGLYVSRSDPTITGCILEENTVTGRGAGAMLYRYGGLFTDNIVQNNVSTDDRDWNGAGIYLYEATGTVQGNFIAWNVSGGVSGDGGGIMIARGTPVVDANWLVGNVATATGGGIRSAWAAPLISNNVIADSVPDGIALSYEDAGIVVHNTIVGSSVNGILAYTDPIWYTGTIGPTTAVVNNVIADSGVNGFYVEGYNSMTVWRHNVLSGSGTVDYSGYADMTGVDGNLSTDPLFVGSTDWALQATSPCVDAGEDASAWGVTTDHDGTPRPLGAGWDIGAYESY